MVKLHQWPATQSKSPLSRVVAQPVSGCHTPRSGPGQRGKGGRCSMSGRQSGKHRAQQHRVRPLVIRRSAASPPELAALQGWAPGQAAEASTWSLSRMVTVVDRWAPRATGLLLPVGSASRSRKRSSPS